LALRPPRLPWLWLSGTLGVLILVLAGLGLWQQRLPQRLRNAAQAGQLGACLRLGRQLGALQPLHPEEQALVETCLRRQAQRSWDQGRWWAALDQQRRLVSRSANPMAENRQLQQWRQQLKQWVMHRFQRGELNQAFSLLSSSGETRFPEGQALQEALRENWAFNRFLYEKTQAAVLKKQWWEALDQLNQLEHPWWKTQAAPLRRQVDGAIEALRQRHEDHDSHGPVQGRSAGGQVDPQRLDALVRRRLDEGLGDWAAFQAACRELGGKVHEEGPESDCRR